MFYLIFTILFNFLFRQLISFITQYILSVNYNFKQIIKSVKIIEKRIEYCAKKLFNVKMNNFLNQKLNTQIQSTIQVLKIYCKTKNCSKIFGSRTQVHKKTTFRSSSCIPNFNQNKNELKIKTNVKLYSRSKH